MSYLRMWFLILFIIKQSFSKFQAKLFGTFSTKVPRAWLGIAGQYRKVDSGRCLFAVHPFFHAFIILNHLRCQDYTRLKDLKSPIIFIYENKTSVDTASTLDG